MGENQKTQVFQPVRITIDFFPVFGLVCFDWVVFGFEGDRKGDSLQRVWHRIRIRS